MTMTKVKSTVQIDLLKGWPSVKLLPPQQIEQGARQVLSNAQQYGPAFGYGPDEGHPELRKEIAKWLTAFYLPQEPVSLERICISGGASQNLACLLQTFTDPIYTRNVWIVAPSYYLAFRIFTDSGFDDGRLRAIPEDAEGIDLDYLEREIQESEKQAQRDGNLTPKLKKPKPWRKIYKHIIYTVPTFANPSGNIMSLSRRAELVRIARRYDALVVADDVYDMLQWPSKANQNQTPMRTAFLPRVVDIDRYLDGGPIDDFGNAVSNGSFSKIIGPGVRTGWVEGTPALAYGISQTGSSRSGGAPSQLTASFISEFMSSGQLSKHVFDLLQPSYARRYHKMLEAVQSHLLPLGLTMLEPHGYVRGGYFLWLTLPESLNGDRIATRAEREENLIIITGPRFQVEGDDKTDITKFDKDLRLCFAWEEENLLEEGVIRLARVIKRALQESI